MNDSSGERSIDKKLASVYPAPASLEPSTPTHKPGRRLVTSNTGSFADLIVKADPNTVGVKTTLSGLLQTMNPTWQRACLFLTKDSVISVFQANAASLFGDTLASYSVGASSDALLYREQDASFLLYRLLDDILDEIPELVAKYRAQILACEEEAFSQKRVSTSKEEELTRQLHLYQRELQTMKAQLAPMERVITALMLREGHTANKVSEECVDSLEELKQAIPEALELAAQVLEDVRTILDDIDAISAAAGALIELKFSLTAFRSTVSQQVIAAVSVVFLPITWWAGVYGTNFVILPELNWGVKDPEIVEGTALGYMWLWVMMTFLAIIAMWFTKYLKLW